jgi:hypothetical protein
MRSIVIYYSMTGNTKTIATAIQQGVGPGCNLVSMEIRDKSTRIYFAKLAESMMKYKELRRFRILFPPEEEGTKKPLSRRKQHPRIKVQDGVTKILDETNET